MDCIGILTKSLISPIPDVDSLGEATIFLTLDRHTGQWKVVVGPVNLEQTAFVYHDGAYKYKRMPFGLTNAPAAFQRALDIILAGVKRQIRLIYLDDVIVH